MLKNLSLILITLVLSQFLIFAEDSLQQKPKIAVIDFQSIGDINNNTQLGIAVAENLRTSLIVSNQYQVIERSALAKIMEEQKLQVTGIVDQSEAIELGKLAGAEIMVMGSITKIGDTYTLNVRFIDIATSVASTAKKIEGKSQNDIPYMIDETVKSLVSKETVTTVPKKEENNSTIKDTSSTTPVSTSEKTKDAFNLNFLTENPNLEFGAKIGYIYKISEITAHYYYYSWNYKEYKNSLAIGGTAKYKLFNSISLQPELIYVFGNSNYLQIPILANWNFYEFRNISCSLIGGIYLSTASNIGVAIGTNVKHNSFVTDFRIESDSGESVKSTTYTLSLGYIF